MAQQQDNLLYFDIRARGEPIRMLYSIAGKSYKDEMVSFADWPAIKSNQPLDQLPVLKTKEGTLILSNVICRHLAKKFGLVGSGLWDETQNDLVAETCMEVMGNVIKNVYSWKIFKNAEPENKEKVLEEVKEHLVKRVNYIQSIAEQRGKKYILCNQMQLADVFLYTTLEFCKTAIPDSMEITPWAKKFMSSILSCEKVKKYLAERPESSIGI